MTKNPMNLTQKIIKEHLVAGEMVVGEEIAIRIDQTLTQDATGTMAYLQFETLKVPRVKTKLSVSYVDHNTLQSGFENADDHLYLQSVAAKHGVYFSRPGNGICHQVNVERFGVPGRTLLGSDSHTPTGGGIGMLAIGSGGLDVAVAMGGGPFNLPMPKVVEVRLKGVLRPWVSAKDVILELLRRLSVKGGVGKVMEYTGSGIKRLSVPQRATITNMGAELGATTSLFPSDAVTQSFLRAQGRARDFRRLEADKGATYDELVEIDLGKLEPLLACPHSPDNITPVRKLAGKPVHQVAIGSCTNSSFRDLMVVAKAMKGKVVHPNVSLVISPGSRQVVEMLAKNGALADLIATGARFVENTCGPCIGMGQSPPSGGVSIRTFNRNFEGRSGTADGQIYLASPEVAVAAAIKGVFYDPRKLGKYPKVDEPKKFLLDDRMVIKPPRDGKKVKVRCGPNIKPLPLNTALSDRLELEVLLKTGDNITTDHIMPAGAKVLPFRSNIPAISRFVFSGVDSTFAERAKTAGGGFVVGGGNYGQGSSREHAALAPMYLGVKAVMAKSFARIHKANLVNFGILPLTFADNTGYNDLEQGDRLVIEGLRASIKAGNKITLKNVRSGGMVVLTHDLSERQRQVILVGGLLNYTRQGGGKKRR